MLLNLGLEQLSDSKNSPISMESIDADYIALLEDALYGAADMDDAADAQLSNLIALNDALKKVGYAREALIVLAHDPAFKAIINSDRNPQVALENHITASTEYTLMNITTLAGGSLAAALLGKILATYVRKYLYRISKVKRIVTAAIATPPSDASFKGLDGIVYGVYNAALFMKLVTFAQTLQDGLITITKDPKMDIAPVIAAYQRAGITVTKKGSVNVHSEVSFKDVLSILTPNTAANKGYTSATYVECCKGLLGLINKLDVITAAKEVKIDENVENRAEKIRFLKSSIKLCMELIHNLGMVAIRCYSKAKVVASAATPTKEGK